jgi:MFS family permease
MISLLRQPTLRRFFIAHGQSQLGTGAGYVALVLIAYHRLHSGWAIALVLLADFLPGTLLSSYFGVLADRYPRRPLVITAELGRAAAFVGLAFIGSFGATVGLALLAGVGTALFRPPINASLPELVGVEERSRATALYGALQNLGITVGPAVCGLALLFGPPTWVLIGNGATFLVSACLLARVPLGSRSGVASENGESPAGTWRAAREGLRCATQQPGLGPLILIGAASVLCAALINVVEPVLATVALHGGSSGFSILVSAYGLGMVAGSVYTSRLGSRLRTLRAHFLIAVAVTGLAMFGCAASANVVEALTPFAVAGFANTVIVVPEIRLLQELVAERLRGRVFGLWDSAECACFVIAFLAAGALLSVLGPRSVYVLSGTLLLVTAAVGARAFRLPGEPVEAPARIAQEGMPRAEFA